MADHAAFLPFFERRHVELSRLAYLLTGDASVADDLAADALGQVRRAWPRVGGDDPAGYARGIVAELSRRHERRALFGTGRRVAAAPGNELLAALSRLPHRQRVCVVLRYAFGLTDGEVAKALGISAGTARSRASRGARQLGELLGGASGATRLGGWQEAR